MARKNNKNKTLDTIFNNLTKPISNYNMLLGIIIIIMLATPITLLINKYAYDENGKLVCDDYVLNSYLFTALGFCYVAIGVLIERKILLIQKMLTFGLIGMLLFMGVILFIFYLLSKKINETNPEKFLIINAYFFILCALFGLLLSLTLMLGLKTNVLYPAIAITILITITMGVIGYKYGDQFISINFDKYLKYALIIYIVYLFILPLFVRDTKTLLLASGIPGAIIFSLLLLSYNNKLRENSSTCVVPNYPKEAVGLIIKIGNLLTDIINILMAVKGRRSGNRLVF
jgi:hypothetical protein